MALDKLKLSEPTSPVSSGTSADHPVILCIFISFVVALVCAIAMFTGARSSSYALEALFAISVTVFLCCIVTALSRRAAANFRDHDPRDKSK